MGLSSNIIWHQSFNDTIRKIIDDGKIYCAYSVERIKYGGDKSFEMAFPMISFCDIPLADFNEYIDKYGGTSMGVKKQWGKNNGFSPVWYRNKDDKSLSNLIKAFEEETKGIENVMKYNDHQIALWNILARTKSYEGSLTVKKKKNKNQQVATIEEVYSNYRFYDEREVRYVPPYDELVDNEVRPILTKEEYDKYKEDHDNSPIIKELSLNIAASDVDYIVYKTGATHLMNLISKKDSRCNVAFLSHTQVKEDVIGVGHYKLKKEKT